MLWGLYHNISLIYCLPFGGRNLSQGPPPPFCPHVVRNVGVGQSGQRGFWQISGKHEAPFWRGVFFHYANIFIPYRNNFFQATGFQKNDSLEDQVDIVDMSWWDVLENYWSAAPVGKVDLFQFLGINCCAWLLLLQVFSLSPRIIIKKKQTCFAFLSVLSIWKGLFKWHFQLEEKQASFILYN